MNKLRKTRLKIGMTIEQAAVHAGISYRTLSDYELDKHEPTVRVLRKLAALYETKVSDLIEEDV